MAEGPSRRAIVGGGTGLVAASAFGIWNPSSVFGQVPRTRLDITTFAQNPARLANFEAAVGEMQARSVKDPNDPKGWRANADLHRNFCSIPGSAPAQIHFCWWFLAWHRAYIVVTERKIRAISGDDTFSYPYWNWSSDRLIPAAYARSGSPLANAIRYARAQPPGLKDSEVGYRTDDPRLKALGVVALDASSFEAATPDDIPFSFGGIARPNSFQEYGNNAIEGTPHGPVHNFVGGIKTVGGRTIPGDMTDFATAARDPIFFAHHGNLDQLWETWRRAAGHRASEPAIDAFAKHSFVFTWIDGTPIEVAMSDILETSKLGYVYDYLDVFRPTLIAQASPQTITDSTDATAASLPPILSQKIRMPAVSPKANLESRNVREYLELSGVETPTEPMNVSVVIKQAGAPTSEPGIEVGGFAAVSIGGKVSWPSDRLVFDITGVSEQNGGKEMLVQLIPSRLGESSERNYPPLKVEKVEIITRR